MKNNPRSPSISKQSPIFKDKTTTAAVPPLGRTYTT
ncbi:unnamed protein product, partial [Rotaria sordida]